MRLRIDRKSLQRLQKNLMVLTQEVDASLGDAQRQTADAIMRQSVAEIPRRTGTAALSRYISEPDIGTESIRTAFGYAPPDNNPINPETGKPASNYIVEIHEDFTVPLQTGKQKFLEDPLMDHQQTYFRSLDRALHRAFSRAIRG